jgi:Tfp pilus assembly protein PilF
VKRLFLVVSSFSLFGAAAGCVGGGTQATGLDSAAALEAPSGGLGQRAAAGSEPTGFTGWLSSTGEAISDALTIEETVLPAEDGVDLNSKPKISPELHFAQAQILERKGELGTAIAKYEAALKIDAKHVPSKLALARVYDRQGRLADAERLYREAVIDQPENPVPFNDLGLFFARQKKLDDARVALETAVRLESKSPLYRNNLAAVHVEAGVPVKAAQALEPVFGKAVASYNVAYLLKERNQIGAAREWSLHATKLDPTMAPAHALLAETDRLLRVAAGPEPAGASGQR